jgi:hypothetical protein
LIYNYINKGGKKEKNLFFLEFFFSNYTGKPSIPFIYTETPRGKNDEAKSDKGSQIAVKREISEENDENDMDNMDFSSEDNSNSYSQGKNLVQNVKDNLNTLSSSSYNKKKTTLKRWWTPEEVSFSIFNFY